MMKKLMKYLFLSCLKATELIEKKYIFKLTFREKIQLTLHKAMCEACSNYEKQDLMIEKAIEKQTPKAKDIKSVDIKDFKKSILEKIK